MRVESVASVGVIVREPAEGQELFRAAMGIDFEGVDRDYVFTTKLDGASHFGIWPLAQAADACFGSQTWPADVPIPQANIELLVGQHTLPLRSGACRLHEAGSV
jgi:hypothetical protein